MPASLSFQYDLNSNIRRRSATYYATITNTNGNITGTGQTTLDQWYKYDAMNRFVLTKGRFVGAAGSGYIERGVTGSDITYDQAGNRVTMRDTAKNGSLWEEHKEFYTYTDDGYLDHVNVGIGATSSGDVPPAYSGSGVLRAQYSYDTMGRATSTSEYDTNGTTVRYSRTGITYNTKSQLTHDVVTSWKTGNFTWVTTTDYDYNDDTNLNGSYTDSGDLYQGGSLMHSHSTVTKNGVSQPQTDTKNIYTWYDGPLQFQLIYKPNTTTTWTSTYGYDNRRLAGININDGQPRSVGFATDLDGKILVRSERTNTYGSSGPIELHYHFDGRQVGDVGNNGTSDIDYVAEIKERMAVTGTGLYRNGGSAPIKYVDFDQSYDPINGYKYQSTASSYTVQDGDTLESIAIALWGDATYWYLIADANGLNGSETLIAGQTLVIPNKLHNSHNSSSIYRVYDPNQAIGDNSPNHAPVPKNGKGCGVIGMILLAVIAVVVTVVTAGAALAALAPGVSGLGAGITALGTGLTAAGAEISAATLIAAGAIGGAVGSIVSQGVGLLTGIQDKFNWGAVGMAAIGGAVGGALGPSGSFAGAVAHGIAGNVITQGIGVATGLQKKFDWVGVAAAGISSAVFYGVSAALPGHAVPGGNGVPGTPPTQLNVAVSGMAGMIANAATRTLISGTDFGDNLMAALPDTVGQIIGSLIVDQMFPPSQSGTQDQPRPGSGGGQVGGKLTPAELANIVDIINNLPDGVPNGAQAPSAMTAPEDAAHQWPGFHDVRVEVKPLPWPLEGQAFAAPMPMGELRPYSYWNDLQGIWNAPISLWDKARYTLGATEFAYSANPRAQGAVQAVGRAGQMIGGAAVSGTGAGAVIGAPAMVLGADNFATGVTRMFVNPDEQTITHGVTLALTGSSQTADKVELATNLLTTLPMAAVEVPGLLAASTAAGSLEKAAVLQARAQELNGLRQGYRGTTAVVSVQNVWTGEVKTWIATESDVMPTKWNGLLGPNERYINAPGHAEETIVNGLGDDWLITSGGSSRNVCIPTCQPLLEGQGLRLGGPTFPGKTDKTPYRMFWSE